MDYFQAIVLGIVQGMTEFLPVSSSGHLALLAHIYRMDEGVRLGLSAALHVGTVFSLLVYFGRRLFAILKGAFADEPQARRDSWRYILFVVIATVPAALAGLLFKQAIEEAFVATSVIGAMLLVTGMLLFITRSRRDNGSSLGWWRVIVIGIAQSLALLPGISRSGMTISTSLLLGLGRREAFEFSFIMAVPITIVASVLELVRLDPQVIAPRPMLIGIVLAFVSGLVALVLLKRAVVGRKFYFFAFYVWLIGLGVLFFLR